MSEPRIYETARLVCFHVEVHDAGLVYYRAAHAAGVLHLSDAEIVERRAARELAHQAHDAVLEARRAFAAKCTVDEERFAETRAVAAIAERARGPT